MYRFRSEIYGTLYDVKSQNCMMMTYWYSLHSTSSPLSLQSSADNGRTTDVWMVVMLTVLTAVWSVSYWVSQWKKYHPITILRNICKYCPVPNKDEITVPVALIMKRSLESSLVPDDWKAAIRPFISWKTSRYSCNCLQERCQVQRF